MGIIKISENKLGLSPALKMLEKVPAADDPVSERAVALINWALTVARCAIYKSGNHHRLDNNCAAGSHLQNKYQNAFKISAFITVIRLVI